MIKAEKKFRLYAILVIFVLLTVLLAVINGVNFTMAAEDADEITQMIADRQGSFVPDTSGGEALKQGGREFRMGPMGPDSPEIYATMRYFTIAFSNGGEEVKTVAYQISAVSESDAQEWAAGLKDGKTGWTRGTYRYRAYKKSGMTYVTVIDQGRELLPSYRILIISAIGEVLILVIGWFVLLAIGRKIYAPIEEADREQKNFIRNANRELRLPLTIISGNTELAERTYGPDDQTRSTRRQIGKLTELVNKLGSIGLFDDIKPDVSEMSISDFLNAALEEKKEEFSSAGIELTADVKPDVSFTGDTGAIKRMLDEIVSNAVRYSLTKASFSLNNENGYVLLEAKNDTDLPDGPADQAFDRFTVLQNAEKKGSGAGLGLAYVKETVKAHNGRVTAAVSGGTFTLRVTL